MFKIKELFEKYKHFVYYVVFGVLTTLINIVSFAICYQYIHIANVPSNIIAWILAVSFAFITNKIWVFDSKSLEIRLVFNEFCKFVSARLATGLLDIVIMYISVDIMHGPAVVFKVISNIVVIILNYVLSRLVVFNSKNRNDNE